VTVRARWVRFVATLLLTTDTSRGASSDLSSLEVDFRVDLLKGILPEDHIIVRNWGSDHFDRFWWN
jgi:hypothetical protein